MGKQDGKNSSRRRNAVICFVCYLKMYGSLISRYAQIRMAGISGFPWEIHRETAGKTSRQQDALIL